MRLDRYFFILASLGFLVSFPSNLEKSCRDFNKNFEFSEEDKYDFNKLVPYSSDKDIFISISEEPFYYEI